MVTAREVFMHRRPAHTLFGGEAISPERSLIRLECRILATPDPDVFRPERRADLTKTLVRAARTPGTRVVLVGDRGSGKTTALTHLARALAAEHGADHVSLTRARPGGAARAAGARVYLIDGLGEVSHAADHIDALTRLLDDYLALASRNDRTSVVIACRSNPWLTDIARRTDVLLIEVSNPSRTQLIEAARAARGPAAEPLLKRLGLDPRDPAVALTLAMMNRTLFARILLTAEPGWDTVHLPPVELIDHLLEGWSQHDDHAGYFLAKAEIGAVATRVAGWLLNTDLCGAVSDGSAREPFTLTDDELWACVAAAGIATDGADRVRAGDVALSPYLGQIGVDRRGAPVYGFVRDEARCYFMARYLARDERLQRWLSAPDQVWRSARVFPDDVASVLSFALLIRHEEAPSSVPRLLDRLLDTADSAPDAPGARGDSERVNRLFVMLGACEGLLQACAWHRSPRLRAAVKQLVSRLAALYDDRGAAQRGHARYYAARRASRCGLAFVETIWRWCSRSTSVHERLFAVEVARQYGVFEPGPEVLRLMVSLAKIEQEALSQDYRQSRVTGAPVADELDRQHLLHHLSEGIHGVLGAVAVPDADAIHIERIVDEVLQPDAVGEAWRRE